MNPTHKKQEHLSRLQHSNNTAAKEIQMKKLCPGFEQKPDLRICTNSWTASPACQLHETLANATGVSAFTEHMHAVDAWPFVSCNWMPQAMNQEHRNPATEPEGMDCTCRCH